VLAVGCAREAAPPHERTPPPAPVVTRVLFVGNSYVYFNNLPDVFRGLAAAGGHEVVTRMIAPGGATLQAQWDTASTRHALGEASWDYVVLQEQSTLGVSHVVDGMPRVTTDEVFRPAAKRWADAIHAGGGKAVFFATWARRDVPEDQAVLDRAYAAAATETHSLVAPIGAAWARATDRASLYDRDGSHPSAEGTYLAAVVLYVTIFGSDPAGLPATLRGQPIDLDTEQLVPGAEAVLVDVSPDRARALQAVAWDAARPR
jgi:hypothetical protein